MRPFIALLFIALSHVVLGQTDKKTFSHEAFMAIVLKNHPAAYSAELIEQAGKSQVLASRGAFDPKLVGDAQQKYFEGKQYYSHLQGGLKIPTWFGVSAEAGYTQNDGIYLNPERNLPDAGLWYAGLRLELGKGLTMNQRLAEFKKAKLYRESTALQRVYQLNQLRFQASMAYWKWFEYYQKKETYLKALANAEERFEGVKSSAEFGDRPQIDTLEAFMTVQSRSLVYQKAAVEFENAELQLETFLWQDGFVPLIIDSLVPTSPIENPSATITLQLDSAIMNHPKLQMNQLKLDGQRIDLRLKKEQLKPQLTLKYNAISEPVSGNPLANYNPSNYTWGAQFSYPILSRKERGGVQLAKLKMQQQELSNLNYETQLRYKISAAMNTYRLALDQVELSEQLMNNNQRLYDAERELFDMGESSVFMINSRENSWLKSQISWIEMQRSAQVALNELNFLMMSN